MRNADQALFHLDAIGRGLLDTLLAPSLEALLLGLFVWALLRIYREQAPRIRHILWMSVVLKPMISLVIPWQGLFELPLSPFSEKAYPSVDMALSTDAVVWREHVFSIITLFWMLAVAVGLIWTAAGGITLYRRSRQTMDIPIPWAQSLFARCQTLAGVKRSVRLRMSDEFASPTLVTIGRPLVVIPSWCLIHMSPQELKQVFLHELIHYARRDHLTLMLVHAAKICFFFHPVIWYAGRRLGVEAERACDVAVINVSRRPDSYASSLLKVAQGSIQAPWRGVLELARSASVAAMRIREVLTGFDGRRNALDPRAIGLLIVCAALSMTPFFHLEIPSLGSGVRIVSDVQPAVTEPEKRVTAPALSLSDPVEARNNDKEAHGLARWITPVEERHDPSPPSVELTFERASIATRMIRPGTTRPDPVRETIRTTGFQPDLLGVPSAAPQPENALTRSGYLEQGHIEIQGTGHSAISPGVSQAISLRAGYFVTRKHELGGVLSIVGLDHRDRTLNDQDNLSGLSPGLRSRPTGGIRDALNVSDHFAGSLEQDNEPVNQKVQFGAFYRYNVVELNRSVVPFVSVGAGVEIRPGRDPVLVDSGMGVRCFISRKAALIVQLDYMKEVELSPRCHINASIGFSTIF